MDPILKEMCISVVMDEINQERFVNLIMESGIYLEELEWKIATRLLGESERINYVASNHAFPAFYQ